MRLWIPPLKPVLAVIAIVLGVQFILALVYWLLAKSFDGFPLYLVYATAPAVAIGAPAGIRFVGRAASLSLWRNRIRSALHSTVIRSAVSVSFSNVDSPADRDWALRAVRMWSPSSFDLLREEDLGDGWRASVRTGRAGLIEMRYSVQDDSSLDDLHAYVTLELPEAPREMRSFARLLEKDFQELVDDLQKELGAPSGIQFTGEFEDSNPYFGLFVRAEAERTGLEQFHAAFRPGKSPGDRVVVDDKRIEITSTSNREFVGLIQSYLGFRPA